MGQSWDKGVSIQIAQLKQRGYSLRKIANIVGISKSSVQRIAPLKVSQKSCSGYLGQSKEISNKPILKYLFEIHNYQVSINILEKPKNWLPNTILNIRKLKFKTLIRNGWEEILFNYNDCSIHLTPYKVLIFPPHINSKISPEDVKLIADRVVLELIPKLEKLLEVKLSNNNITYIDIKKQHIALLQPKIYDILKSMGFDSVKDNNGDLRLILDNSKGNKHIEAIHKAYAESDLDRLQEHFLSILDKDTPTIQELSKAIGSLATQSLETARGLGAVVNILGINLKREQELTTKETDKTLPEYIG